MYRTFPLILLLSTGCAISQEKFVEKYAAQVCDNLDACGKLTTVYGTYDECITDQEIIADEEMIGDGCQIISDKARACLKELRAANGECGQTKKDPAPSCAEVADCAGGGGSDTGP